jgi:excisionase family DNA binding protein
MQGNDNTAAAAQGATPGRRRTTGTRIPEPGTVAFYKVSEVAAMFRMSSLTLYRAIQDGEFPGIRVRRRYVIPAKPIDAMRQMAEAGQFVDPMVWVRDQREAVEGGVVG